MAVQCDIRFEDQIKNAVEKAVETFGGIDILINNASAISLTPVEQTEPKAFGLMHDINVKGTFFVSKACIPYLKKGTNAHILNLSPPINLDQKWLTNHVAYTMSKYNMTMIALGLVRGIKKIQYRGQYFVAENNDCHCCCSQFIGRRNVGSNEPQHLKLSPIAHFIFYKSHPAECTGNSFIDEEVLAQEGITDLEKYAVNPGGKLIYRLIF